MTRRGRLKGARGASGQRLSKGNRRTHYEESPGESAREILEPLFDVLVRTGHSPKVLLKEFTRIGMTSKEPRRRWDPSGADFLADLPDVIARWHADPQYQSRAGRPLSLNLRRGRKSLRALIANVLPDADPKNVLRVLVQMKGVRRQGGGYVPTGRQLSFRQHDGRVYGLSLLGRVLRTVQRNLSGRQKPIFECSAVNSNFPVRALGTFHRRFGPRAEGFLWDTDTGLRRYEMEHPGGKRTRLGIEVFVFEELPIPIARSSRRRRR